MAVQVHIILKRGEDEIDFDTRDFEALPRIGETLYITQGMDARKPSIDGAANCVVVDVWYDLRLASRSPVLPMIVIEPRSVADAALLDTLFADMESEHGE